MAQWIEDPQGREEVEKVTKELKLPVWKANHKGKFRDFWNELWDKIEDYCLKLKEGSKKTDDRLTSALGRHDGDFPIANAIVGDVYYSDVTKKYYKCKIGGPAPMPNGNFIDLSILENLNRLENLSTFKIQEFFSIPSGIKFTVYQYGNLILITAYTYYVEFLAYGVQYKCTLPFNCYDNSTAISGNYGTCGHFTLRDNVLIVNSTDSKNPLKNSFMGQMVTFLK